MKVKHHSACYPVDDPAAYARAHGLIGNHEVSARAKVGAWRWPIVDKYRDRVLEIVRSGYTIDLGGFAGPIGYGAVVVDYQNPHDSPRALWDVPPDADCVFCCHTFEHFTDPAGALAAITHKLKSGGFLIIVVPSWRKTNLRAENWQYHESTFCLAWETNASPGYIRLDSMLEEWGYEIEVADTEHDNIIVIGRKP